jgi:hypothetical protein
MSKPQGPARLEGLGEMKKKNKKKSFISTTTAANARDFDLSFFYHVTKKCISCVDAPMVAALRPIQPPIKWIPMGGRGQVFVSSS